MLRIALIPALLMLMVALASCGGAGSPARDQSAPAISPTIGNPPAGQLPALSELPAAQGKRHVSIAEYELLQDAPVMTSANGSAAWAPGSLTLDPSLNSGVSWALFALPGFPTDGSIVPQSVILQRDNECWIAASDYSKSRWSYLASPIPGSITVNGGAGLLSTAGTFYVAVLGLPQAGNPTGQVAATSLRVVTSAAFPGDPTAVLKHLDASGKEASGIPAFFSAEGSDPGAGSSITAVRYKWGDGSPDDVTADPLTEVQHTWATNGIKPVALSVTNDLGRSASLTYYIDVGDPFRELLLVYNSDIVASADLADYYASARYGRMIDPAYILGLPLGAGSENADFDRPTYETKIRDPIKAYLDASGHKDSIKYILLVKGVPHRIETGDGNTRASIDSELCLLYSDLGPANSGYPYDIWVYNGPPDLGWGTTGFYRCGDTDFQPNTFQVTFDPTYEQPADGDETTYTLNYLVGRLSAYDYAEAMLLVDRSLAADTTGSGWVIMDSSDQDFAGNPQDYYDSMVDPVFQYPSSTTPADDSLEELMIASGYNEFADNTSERIVNGSPSLPPGFTNSVIGYTGWGVNHSGGSWAHGSDYILQDLQWNYLPGACFVSYESYNGWNFNGGNLGNRNGQGQICDFLRMGGTVAIGNAWEPYTIGCGDERIAFDRYINHGDRWIEAAYKGLWLVSWMEVVVGDPLCRVKP